jgi:flagellar biogenesis protein FliO
MKTKTFSMRLFVFLLIALCLVVYFIFLNNVKESDKRRGVAYVSYIRVLNESSIMQQEKIRAEKVALLAQEAEKRATEKFGPA